MTDKQADALLKERRWWLWQFESIHISYDMMFTHDEYELEDWTDE